MEKSHVVPRIYGYAVCLASIILALIAIGNIVSAVFDRIDPANIRNFSYNIQMHDVSSFEAYKAEYQTNSSFTTADKSTLSSTTLSDDQLKVNYEAVRTSQINAVKVGSAKTLTIHGALLILAIALFFGHWKWLKKLDK